MFDYLFTILTKSARSIHMNKINQLLGLML